MNSFNSINSVNHVNSINHDNSVNSVSNVLCGATSISDGIFYDSKHSIVIQMIQNMNLRHLLRQFKKSKHTHLENMSSRLENVKRFVEVWSRCVSTYPLDV